MKLPHESYEQNLFINCPFDREYEPLLDALLFGVVFCGFKPRCALEIRLDGKDQTRLGKLFRIMEECRFGIHDLSRTTLDAENHLPRFNMPLELGMFLGMKHSGKPQQRRKLWLGLDTATYTYQKCVSDLAGVDIPVHDNSPQKLIQIIRDWLNDFTVRPVPTARAITQSFLTFVELRPAICKQLGQDHMNMPFRDRLTLIGGYIDETGQPA